MEQNQTSKLSTLETVSLFLGINIKGLSLLGVLVTALGVFYTFGFLISIGESWAFAGAVASPAHLIRISLLMFSLWFLPILMTIYMLSPSYDPHAFIKAFNYDQNRKRPSLWEWVLLALLTLFSFVALILIEKLSLIYQRSLVWVIYSIVAGISVASFLRWMNKEKLQLTKHIASETREKAGFEFFLTCLNYSLRVALSIIGLIWLLMISVFFIARPHEWYSLMFAISLVFSILLFAMTTRDTKLFTMISVALFGLYFIFSILNTDSRPELWQRLGLGNFQATLVCSSDRCNRLVEDSGFVCIVLDLGDRWAIKNQQTGTSGWLSLKSDFFLVTENSRTICDSEEAS